MEMTRVTDFIPSVIKDGDTYGLMLVKLDKCPICLRQMVKEPKRNTPFPHYIKINFDSQLKRANWVKESDVLVDDEPICVECEKAGKADFLCALCEQRKPTDKIQDKIGDPPEFLCTDCYETVSAKVWAEKKAELNERHRYDYE